MRRAACPPGCGRTCPPHSAYFAYPSDAASLAAVNTDIAGNLHRLMYIDQTASQQARLMGPRSAVFVHQGRRFAAGKAEEQDHAIL
jgi:hypothetical protein